MASTFKTEKMKLSQFTATDKPAWLSDYNNDMQKIDNAFEGMTAEFEEASAQAVAEMTEAVNEVLSGFQEVAPHVQTSIDSMFMDDCERQVGWYMTAKNANNEPLYKPQYRIRQYIDNVAASAGEIQFSGIANNENTKYAGGELYERTSETWAQLPYVHTSALAAQISIHSISSGSFFLTVGTSQATINGYAYLYFTYTKTTDTAKTKSDILAGK